MDRQWTANGSSDASLLRVFTIANAGLAASALALWAYIGPFIAEPLSAATRIQVDIATQPAIDNPTYAMTWLAPLLAIVLSHSAKTSNYHRLARWIGAYPLVMLGMVLIWYFAFPDYR